MSVATIQLEADISFLRGKFLGTCRREAERFRFELGTVGYLIHDNDQCRQEVWLVDIAEKGIGFCSEWPLDRGTALDLALVGHAKGPIAIRAKVVHATKRPTGDWLIGCEFEQRLPVALLTDVL
ncbi:MAG TPA: PilZ domain-containing protein [Gemmataceae bacterium]|nr:PilZ domain-containing protein [Gemmataceae bacterium]